jgi:hypothetical protein
MIKLPKSQLKTIIREEYLRMRLNEEKVVLKWEKTGLLERVNERNKPAVAQRLDEGMSRVLHAYKSGKISQEQAQKLSDRVIISMRSVLNPQ